VPAGYFENLSDNIQSRIAVETAMEAGEAFEVPVGYFENLSSEIQSRVFVEEALAVEGPLQYRRVILNSLMSKF
jgi:hypothetical protein